MREKQAPSRTGRRSPLLLTLMLFSLPCFSTEDPLQTFQRSKEKAVSSINEMKTLHSLYEALWHEGFNLEYFEDPFRHASFENGSRRVSTGHQGHYEAIRRDPLERFLFGGPTRRWVPAKESQRYKKVPRHEPIQSNARYDLADRLNYTIENLDDAETALLKLLEIDRLQPLEVEKHLRRAIQSLSSRSKYFYENYQKRQWLFNEAPRQNLLNSVEESNQGEEHEEFLARIETVGTELLKQALAVDEELKAMQRLILLEYLIKVPQTLQSKNKSELQALDSTELNEEFTDTITDWVFPELRRSREALQTK